MKQNNENNSQNAIEEQNVSSAPAEDVPALETVLDEEQKSDNGQPINEPAAQTFFEKALNALKKFGKAAWEYIKGAKVELIVAVALLIVDLVTKALVGKYMYLGEDITLIPDFLHITSVHNDKAAFGSAFGMEEKLSGGQIRIVFLIVTLIAMGVFSYILYRCRRRHFLMRLSIAMILSGALGNFIDRLVYAYVRDFIHFYFLGCSLPWLGEDFPVFNVADSALTVGVILFLIYFIAIYREPKPANKQATQTAEQSDNVGQDQDISQDTNADAEAENDENISDAQQCSQTKNNAEDNQIE